VVADAVRAHEGELQPLPGRAGRRDCLQGQGDPPLRQGHTRQEEGNRGIGAAVRPAHQVAQGDPHALPVHPALPLRRTLNPQTRTAAFRGKLGDSGYLRGQSIAAQPGFPFAEASQTDGIGPAALMFP
jgi:hypothetical protein